ncbi:unnamed protein product (macronuclear) [Paramecium tetraurelia]|uniref:MORN repeat protein n=1 Tax=Paramecium tetraurelia TaxID=5888 RepID=A0C7A2_PARTE|nr:uncharacterized protein GSPATT00035799001 [Paramecium tetraurelia]CAK66669.1 unnamed protein product [Paramecium tetraurelia]|eukprot:XP_001434066.1 hypothetical protein (macronuclear) [Paramecium tetraurelia strain d4-2]
MKPTKQIFNENDLAKQEQDKVILNVSGWQPTKISQAFPLTRTDYSIIFTEDHEVIYKQQGKYLKIYKEEDFQYSEIIYNLERLNKLEWKGKHDQNQQEFSKQKAFWDGELTKLGGVCTKQRLRIGIWVEPWENYWSGCQVTFEGYYDENGHRVEKWKYRDESNEEMQNRQFVFSGGGYFQDDGQKSGIWKELQVAYNGMQFNLDYNRNNQSIQIGQYNKGLKYGEWMTIYNKKIIGGGIYNEKGHKVGMWIEQVDHFSKQIIIPNDIKSAIINPHLQESTILWE